MALYAVFANQMRLLLAYDGFRAGWAAYSFGPGKGKLGHGFVKTFRAETMGHPDLGLDHLLEPVPFALYPATHATYRPHIPPWVHPGNRPRGI